MRTIARCCASPRNDGARHSSRCPHASLRGATRRSNPECCRGKTSGLLRGACHRARIRATRWLAMTWRERRICPCANCLSCTFSLALSGKSKPCSRASRLRMRGASRSSRTLEAGCDGRGVLSDEQHDADGEVVWSWRPWAGAKLAERSADDGDNKAWSPGRARISRNTIAQGMPAAPAEPVVLPRAFLLHADHGCQPASGIPCALLLR